ncbi:ankyrin repeat-containing domain protein [Xylariaceae sp. FL1651]|nr:ankyrin repeat-containing domain protein [Xylariaceae sp. FL1651]
MATAASNEGKPSKVTERELAVLADHAATNQVHAMNAVLDTICEREEKTGSEVITVFAINAASQTLVHTAAEHGHTGILELLYQRLLQDIIYNPKDNSKASAVARFMNQKDREGNTACHIAATHGQLNFLHQLVDYGASLDIKNNAGWSTLHAAAKKGHVETVDWLLQKGLDINAQTSKGNTCLHLVARDDWYEVAKLLIRKGADLEIRNQHRLLPYQIADILHCEAFTGLLMEMNVYRPSVEDLDYDWDAMLRSIDDYFE